MRNTPHAGADPGDPIDLTTIGYGGPWPALLDDLVATHLAPPDTQAEITCGRVSRADRGAATVLTPSGPVRVIWTPATPPPVTGDWVLLSGRPLSADGPHQLIDTAPRQTAITRPTTHGQRSSGEHDQVLAANIDLVGVVAPVDGDLHIRRLERGLVMAYESGATPVVLLTKIDLCEDLAWAHRQAESAAVGVDVLSLSPITGEGVDHLRRMLAPSRTIAMLGTSGAGKSTLTNALLGEDVLTTADVRAKDGKGRHTTTHRELVPLPSGGAVLDTPGLRTLGLGVVSEGMAQAFPDVESVADGCRFSDCRHEGEPGCAVLAALDSGELEPDRLEGWMRIRAASENAALRADVAAWRSATRSWGRVAREAQAMKRRDS